MDVSESPDQAEALEAYWAERKPRLLAGLAGIWKRSLDREAIIAARSCYSVGQALIGYAIDLMLLGEEAEAARFLDTALFYLDEAKRTHDTWVYTGEQVPFGESEGDLHQALARWLQGERLDLAALRAAQVIRDAWYTGLWNGKRPHTGFEIRTWIREKLVVADFAGAAAIGDRFPRSGARGPDQVEERELLLVAKGLRDATDADALATAESAMEALYRAKTNWLTMDREIVLNVDRVWIALIRGFFFKSLTDAREIVARMRLRV
jgi:hypothetical protein